MYPNNSIGSISAFEIVELRLTPEEKRFLDEYNICISDAYLGMLRAYRLNKTIWQTSAMDVFLSLYPGIGGEEYKKWQAANNDSLRKQLHDWLSKIMVLSTDDLERVFENNYHLFDSAR
jgi:hypothetical protein